MKCDKWVSFPVDCIPKSFMHNVQSFIITGVMCPFIRLITNFAPNINKINRLDTKKDRTASEPS